MPLDLRPLALGELFDRAFMLYRRHFWLFVGVTAVPGLVALIVTLTQVALQGASVPAPNATALDPSAPVANLGMVIGLFGGMIVALIAYWIVYMVALGATTFAVSEIYVGRTVTIPHVFSRMRGRIGALVILLLLIGLRVGGVGLLGMFALGAGVAVGTLVNPVLGGLIAIVVSLATLGVCIFMALRYGVAVPALVLEGLPPGQSIRRSVELTRGRLGRVLLLVVCATLVTYAALVLFQGPFFGGALFAGLESRLGFWLNIAGAVSGTIGTALTTPFLIIGLVLIYYDARIREEGFDLELTLAALDGEPSGT